MPLSDALRDALEGVLARHGIAPGADSLHSWRCENPDRFPGYCHCIPDLLEDLLVTARADTDALRARVVALEGALRAMVKAAEMDIPTPRVLVRMETARDLLAAPPVSPAPNSHHTPAPDASAP